MFILAYVTFLFKDDVAYDYLGHEFCLYTDTNI